MNSELLKAYPGIPLLLAWPAFGDAIDVAIAENLEPRHVVDKIQTAIRSMAADIGTLTERQTAILAEIDHPDMLRYVMGKMGCC